MQRAGGLDPIWVEQGHDIVVKGEKTGKRTRPRWFFRNGVNTFETSGDIEEMSKLASKRVSERIEKNKPKGWDNLKDKNK